jgi:hypothetical protein
MSQQITVVCTRRLTGTPVENIVAPMGNLFTVPLRSKVQHVRIEMRERDRENWRPLRRDDLIPEDGQWLVFALDENDGREIAVCTFLGGTGLLRRENYADFAYDHFGDHESYAARHEAVIQRAFHADFCYSVQARWGCCLDEFLAQTLLYSLATVGEGIIQGEDADPYARIGPCTGEEFRNALTADSAGLFREWRIGLEKEIQAL